jgi:hypothetical protein
MHLKKKINIDKYNFKTYSEYHFVMDKKNIKFNALTPGVARSNDNYFRRRRIIRTENGMLHTTLYERLSII